MKDKVVSPFKTNNPEEYGKQSKYGTENRPCKLKMQKQFEDNIIKNIRNLLKENKAIKDRILRDTRTFLNRNMIITKQYK